MARGYCCNNINYKSSNINCKLELDKFLNICIHRTSPANNLYEAERENHSEKINHHPDPIIRTVNQDRHSESQKPIFKRENFPKKIRIVSNQTNEIGLRVRGKVTRKPKKCTNLEQDLSRFETMPFPQTLSLKSTY